MTALEVRLVLKRSRRRDHMLAHARAVLRRAPRNERPAIMYRLVERMCRECFDFEVRS